MKYNNISNVSEKLKSGWVLIIVSILIVFLIKDTMEVFKIPYVNNNTHTTHIGFRIGLMSRKLYEPILDLFLIYIVLFKIDFKIKYNII